MTWGPFTPSVTRAESAPPCDSDAIVSLFLHRMCVPFLFPWRGRKLLVGGEGAEGRTGGLAPVFLFIELKVSGMSGITDAVYLCCAAAAAQPTSHTPISQQLRPASAARQGFVLTKPWEPASCHARRRNAPEQLCGWRRSPVWE